MGAEGVGPRHEDKMHQRLTGFFGELNAAHPVGLPQLAPGTGPVHMGFEKARVEGKGFALKAGFEVRPDEGLDRLDAIGCQHLHEEVGGIQLVVLVLQPCQHQADVELIHLPG